MFTGIIQEVGKLRQVLQYNKGKILEISCNGITIEGLSIGDSVSMNGACQTVIKKTADTFSVYTASNTLAVTNLGIIRVGDYINLERPLSVQSLLDGHIVQGHIDGIGIIKKLERLEDELNIEITCDASLLDYIVNKASISIEGISLTVSDIYKESFIVSIIPLTSDKTNLKYKKIGDRINIEIDLIAKYVARFLKNSKALDKKSTDSLSKEFLEKHGFL